MDLPLSEARRSLLHGETLDPSSDSNLLRWRVNANAAPKMLPPRVSIPLKPPPRPWEAFALDGYHAPSKLQLRAANSKLFPSELFPSTLLLSRMKQRWDMTSLAGRMDPHWSSFLNQVREEAEREEESMHDDASFMGQQEGNTIQPIWTTSKVVRNRMFALGARMRSWISVGGPSPYCYVDLQVCTLHHSLPYTTLHFTHVLTTSHPPGPIQYLLR